MLARLPQIIYVSLVFAGYYLYSREILAFLPQPYAPVWHQWTAGLAVGVALLSFGVVRSSDPGLITIKNHDSHCKPDLANLKHCKTCKWARPIGSRHCSICNRCIARRDHHCFVVDNCIGVKNFPHFMLFMLANLLLCLYGTTLGILVLTGVLRRHVNLEALHIDYKTGAVYSMKDKPVACMIWLAIRLPSPVIVTVMMATCFLTATSFLLCNVRQYVRLQSSNVTDKRA